ncbi:hypothetical protein, partial [uncultured Paraglaciecola sp.]|uniref:hypothetical protein n=1 Tax=uncultured Paraglaciecola sp. TaxID=1765024 RepID=UPI0025D0F237
VLPVHQNWLQTVSSKPPLLLFIYGNWVICTGYLLSEITYKKRLDVHYTVFVCSANQAVLKVNSKSLF